MKLYAMVFALLVATVPLTADQGWDSTKNLIRIRPSVDGTHTIYWDNDLVYQKFAVQISYHGQGEKDIKFLYEFIEVRYTLEDVGPPKAEGVRDFDCIRKYHKIAYSTPTKINGMDAAIEVYDGPKGYLIQRSFVVITEQTEEGSTQ